MLNDCQRSNEAIALFCYKIRRACDSGTPGRVEGNEDFESSRIAHSHLVHALSWNIAIGSRGHAVSLSVFRVTGAPLSVDR